MVSSRVAKCPAQDTSLCCGDVNFTVHTVDVGGGARALLGQSTDRATDKRGRAKNPSKIELLRFAGGTPSNFRDHDAADDCRMTAIGVLFIMTMERAPKM